MPAYRYYHEAVLHIYITHVVIQNTRLNAMIMVQVEMSSEQLYTRVYIHGDIRYIICELTLCKKKQDFLTEFVRHYKLGEIEIVINSTI